MAFNNRDSDFLPWPLTHSDQEQKTKFNVNLNTNFTVLLQNFKCLNYEI